MVKFSAGVLSSPFCNVICHLIENIQNLKDYVGQLFQIQMQNVLLQLDDQNQKILC